MATLKKPKMDLIWVQSIWFWRILAVVNLLYTFTECSFYKYSSTGTCVCLESSMPVSPWGEAVQQLSLGNGGGQSFIALVLELLAAALGWKQGYKSLMYCRATWKHKITPALTILDVSELWISQMCISLDCCRIRLECLKRNHSETRTMCKLYKRELTPPGDATCKNWGNSINTVPPCETLHTHILNIHSFNNISHI